MSVGFRYLIASAAVAVGSSVLAALPVAANDDALTLADKFAQPTSTVTAAPKDQSTSEPQRRRRSARTLQSQPPRTPTRVVVQPDANDQFDALMIQLDALAAKAKDEQAANEAQPRAVTATDADDTVLRIRPTHEAASDDPRPAVVLKPDMQPNLAAPQPARVTADIGDEYVFGPPRRRPAKTSVAGQTIGKAAAATRRVTILLEMKPGARGIRRFNKTADPILCLGQDCYISRGASRDARQMARRRAFGTVNTLGARAGACRKSLRCVFRNVPVPSGGLSLQPIDLRILRHDRREVRDAKVDRSCRMAAGRIACDAVLKSESYTIWVVPEAVAKEAGEQRLLRTVSRGLSAG